MNGNTPMSRYNRKSSDSITASLIRKLVDFGVRFYGGVEHISLLDKVGLVKMRKEDGRLHGRDEIVGTDGHSVEEASHSEAVVIIVNGADILNLAHPDIFALVKNSGSSVRLTTALPDTAGPVFPVVSATLGRDFTMNRQYEASTTNAVN